tara:strand:- start:568 stop:1998 length:1431 start_codon:yes stop_codon:yes gene_type:complete
MTLQVANNAFGELNADINTTVTTIVLKSGNGARFPSLAGSQYFYATLIDTSNNLEIVKATARSSDTLTVVRAQDGTSARSFVANDRIELRPVAAFFDTYQQKESSVDMNGTELVLDADGDTSITADTDDQIDIKIAGADDFAFKANTFEVQTGSNIDMNGTELVLDADGDTSITADTDDSIDFKTAGTDRVNIDSAGHVQVKTGSLTINTVGQVLGVGTNNPGHTIEAKATAPELMLEETSSGGSKRLSMGVTSGGLPFINAEQSGGQIQFNMSGTLLGRWHEYGLAVGRGVDTSSSTGPLLVYAPTATHAATDALIHVRKDNNQGHSRVLLASQLDSGSFAVRGAIRVNGGQNSLEFESFSDRRMKQDIADLTGAIDKIKELKPKTFKFKQNPSRGTFAGFIAQELNEVFPTWVTKTDDGTGDDVPIVKNKDDKDEEQPWTIGTDALQFYLVGALKEAITKIETLEAKVKALEEA